MDNKERKGDLIIEESYLKELLGRYVYEKYRQKKLLQQIMQADEKDGLYQK